MRALNDAVSLALDSGPRDIVISLGSHFGRRKRLSLEQEADLLLPVSLPCRRDWNLNDDGKVMGGTTRWPYLLVMCYSDPLLLDSKPHARILQMELRGECHWIPLPFPKWPHWINLPFLPFTINLALLIALLGMCDGARLVRAAGAQALTLIIWWWEYQNDYEREFQKLDSDPEATAPRMETE